jgi:hypothetical protein
MDFENSRLNSHELDYMEKRLAEIKGRV